MFSYLFHMLYRLYFPNFLIQTNSRKRKILSVFVFVAERSVLGMHGNMDLDLLSWILSRQHSLLIRTESKGPGQERGGSFSVDQQTGSQETWVQLPATP